MFPQGEWDDNLQLATLYIKNEISCNFTFSITSQLASCYINWNQAKSNFYCFTRFKMKKRTFNIPKVETSSKLIGLTIYVFSEVYLKSPVWKYYLRDKKHGMAKCNKCDSILKVGQSTSTLIRHFYRKSLGPEKTGLLTPKTRLDQESGFWKIRTILHHYTQCEKMAEIIKKM